MNKETLENMISLDLFNSSEWDKLNDLDLKEYNTYISEFINLSSLNMNNINDLAEKVTAPIYYLFSCLQRYYFRNSENVEIPLKDISVSSDYIPDDHIDVFAKIYFFNEVEEDENHKLKITLKFILSDLLYEEEAIYTIETSIKEELEKSTSDINFNKDLIKIRICYIIDHPLEMGGYVIDKFHAYISKKFSLPENSILNKECL